MKLIKYNSQQHYHRIAAMLKAQGHPVPRRVDMPRLGCVALDGKTIVAAVSLHRVENDMGMVGGLVSNPSCPPEQRHEALDMVIKGVMEQAKKHHIIGLIATSRCENTIMRSQRLGFEIAKLSW